MEKQQGPVTHSIRKLAEAATAANDDESTEMVDPYQSHILDGEVSPSGDGHRPKSASPEMDVGEDTVKIITGC